MANQSLGIALPALIADWGVARSAFAPVAALNLAGVAIGTVVGGMLGDRFGRRIGVILAILLFGIMTAAGAFVQNIEMLMAVRFLDGLGIGAAVPNGAALITEFTPLRRRSRGIAIGMVFIPIGGIIAGAAGASVLPHWGWRTLFLVAGSLPIMLALIFAKTLPESPRILARDPKRQGQLVALMGRMGISAPAGAQFAANAEDAHHARAPLSALFGRGRWRDTLLLWTGFFTCLLASYTIFSWVPTMLSSMDFSLTLASTGITAFHMGGVIGCLTCGLLIDRFGSRWSHIGMCGGGSIVAVLLAVTVQNADLQILTFALIMVEGFFVAGLHNSLYTLAANLYGPDARATGIGSASAFGRLGAVLSSYTGVHSLEMFGTTGFFVTVAITLGLCMISGGAIRRQVVGEARPIRPASGNGPAVPPGTGTTCSASGTAD
ncbi:MFS transporter [Parasphingopyxis sp. GrpM-11]|uniref:MFS transporter n=1 Tax=Parasphingopyxis marina TaxID=2761622 RepID=A0A842I2F4_9SPHN|nr:MFS transporter [Parasphingopyxis marina]